MLRELTSFKSWISTIYNIWRLYYKFCLRKSFKELFPYLRRKTNSVVCRSRSRFASAKVLLFLKPPKKHERFFRKMTNNGCKRHNKGTENRWYTLYIIYKGEVRKENFAIKREQRKFIYSAEREQSQDRKAGLKEKSASKRILRLSESRVKLVWTMPSNSKIDKVKSRSKVHFDYGEREQIQDRKAGLKEKWDLRSLMSLRIKEKGEVPSIFRKVTPPLLRWLTRPVEFKVNTFVFVKN